MTRHAIVNNESREVVNVIIWEGAEWLPPRGHLVVKSDTAGIGDIYNEENGEFVKPKE